MKDKRLDVYLQHHSQDKDCIHLVHDLGMGFCGKMMKGNFPLRVDCEGEFLACELENE